MHSTGKYYLELVAGAGCRNKVSGTGTDASCLLFCVSHLRVLLELDILGLRHVHPMHPDVSRWRPNYLRSRDRLRVELGLGQLRSSRLVLHDSGAPRHLAEPPKHNRRSVWLGPEVLPVSRA